MREISTASLFTGGFASFKYMLDRLCIKHSVEFCCELMKPQRDCYELNYGKPKEWFVDITESNFSKYFGKIDLLQASPVCKSWSMAGNRKGLDSDDGMLMYKTIEAIASIQPKVFIVENSASLMSVNNGRDWDLILQQFNKLKGYTISYGKMNEKNYGIPQNRNRLFIVGFRASTYSFNFPSSIPLKLCTKDLLEDNVSEKYNISETMLKGFKAHAKRHKERGNGFGMKVMDVNRVCGAISTKCGTRATDPFVDRNQFNKGARERITKLTPREQARIMGDTEDKFKFGNFSDSKLSEFIGNAIGLGTMEHLLKSILKEYEATEFRDPIKQSLDPMEPVEEKRLF